MTKSIYKINQLGTKRWTINGQLHREDGPAVEYASGTKFWYQNGLLHREDGPAVEFSNGTKFWCLNGRYHREDGPAFEYASEKKEWYLNDKLVGEGERPGNWEELVLLARVEQVMND